MTSLSTAPLGSLVDIVGGGTPSKSRPEFFEGQIPWVTPKDMKVWTILDSEDHISEAAVAASAAKLVPQGTVLVVVRSGVLKHTLPVAIAGRPVTLNQDMKGLLCGEDIEPRFLAFFLKSAAPRLLATVRGTTADNIPLDELRALEVPRLPLVEQGRIADLLDKADAIRRKRKEAIALTEELLRSAFLYMFGDPVTNPKGWPVKPLGELLAMRLRNGLSPASGGKFEAQVLTLSAITRGRFDASAAKPGAFAVEPWDDVRVDARDFLICRGNGNVALVGTAAFPRESMSHMVFPDTMIAARIDPSQVRPAFLNAIWKSDFIRRQIKAGARTTNGTFKVNQTVVEGIEVVLPPPAKQQIFADLEAQVARSARNQHAAIDEANTLFNSLVVRAFSGELEKVR